MSIPAALRNNGIPIYPLDEVFPGRDKVEDIEWIQHCGEQGWMAISKNPQMVFTPSEVTRIRECGARVFHVASTQVPKEVVGLILGRNWLSMVRRARREEPCLWRVYFDSPPRKKIK